MSAAAPLTASRVALPKAVRISIFVVFAVAVALILWQAVGRRLANSAGGSTEAGLGTLFVTTAATVRRKAQAMVIDAGARTEPDDRQAAAVIADLMTRAPYDAQALALAAEFAVRRGDEASARRLLAVAASRTSREPVTLAALISAAFAAGDQDELFNRIDAMWRTTPGAREMAFGLLDGVAAEPQWRGRLVAALRANPVWRPHYLRHMARQGGDLALAASVLGDMAGQGVELTAADSAPLVAAYAAARQIPDAYLAWVSFMPRDRAALARLVFDGGFTRPASQLPFEWTVFEAPGVVSAIRPRPDAPDNPALFIDFSGARAPFIGAQQTLALTPGEYRFSVNGAANGLRNRHGVAWRLDCLGANPRRLMQTQALQNTSSWRQIETRFTVPAGCSFQLLQPDIATAVAVERTATGEVWFDDVSVERVN